MNPHQSPACALRKIVFLTVMGFGVVLLSGPILAILSVMLSLGFVALGFAVVGFMVWIPFRMMVVGHEGALQEVHELGRGVGRGLGGAGRVTGRVLTFPARVLTAVVMGIFFVLGWMIRKTWLTTRVLLEIGLVAAAGVAGGIAVGVAGVGPAHDPELAIPMNAVLGGIIGALVGIVMMIRERRAAALPPMVELVK